MIGQHTSVSFIKVKTEPPSPESAAVGIGAHNVPLDHDYLSNPSSAYCYNLSYAVHGNCSPARPPSAPPEPKRLRTDTSVTNLSDNVSNYSPVSTFSAAPVESELDVDPSTSKDLASVVPRNPSITCDHYEYPRYYFEALIDDAQIRYDKASEFFTSMRSYSSKSEVYVTILQDLFVELAKPPPTLKPELYKRLARLRRSIRHLELKIASRRPRAASNAVPVRDPTPTPTVDLSEKSIPTGNANVTSSVQVPEAVNNLQEYCLRQMKMKEILEQKIYDLAVRERELRQERHEAEAELNYLFGGSANSVVGVGAGDRPKYNCVFCGKHNASHTCWNVATLEERRAFFQMYKICFFCGKQHYGDCHLAGIVVCAWPQCGAKGDHNSALCPTVAYPITKSQVLALRASQNMPTTFVCPPETAKKEVPAPSTSVSCPSPARSPLSKSLSMAQPQTADPSKRPKKRVMVTVMKEPPTKKQCVAE